ncbi:MAG: ABC transporter ATP-binding protein [Actinomycetota bacterium]|nr:energy-coupling factor ABC transporter ATP-binding protein [Actinomycetota bacterium]MDA8117044.1 ABC transporter ATP-binding protein [Actinomycetota bacterium]
MLQHEIELTDVSFRYPSGIAALSHVTTTVDHEAVAIVGQNGSGKTTLAKHLNGLLLPSSGVVRINGADTRRHRVAHLARQVGLVFQNPNHQIFHRTVEAEVAFGPKNVGMPPQRSAQMVADSLELLGLTDVRDRHPYELPLSERKAVCIASVLAMGTPIVVLDEPTTGQDLVGLQRLRALVARLVDQRRSVVAISHDMQFVADAFPRVIIMGGGTILFDGPTRAGLYRLDVLSQTALKAPPVVDLATTLTVPGQPLTADEFAVQFAARRMEARHD